MGWPPPPESGYPKWPPEDSFILIESDGAIEFIYSDELGEMFYGEPQDTRRASHVEPFKAPFDWRPATRWQADMGPVGGPVLGPFESRQQALDAERQWLRAYRGL